MFQAVPDLKELLIHDSHGVQVMGEAIGLYQLGDNLGLQGDELIRFLQTWAFPVFFKGPISQYQVTNEMYGLVEVLRDEEFCTYEYKYCGADLFMRPGIRVNAQDKQVMEAIRQNLKNMFWDDTVNYAPLEELGQAVRKAGNNLFSYTLENQIEVFACDRSRRLGSKPGQELTRLFPLQGMWYDLVDAGIGSAEAPEDYHLWSQYNIPSFGSMPVYIKRSVVPEALAPPKHDCPMCELL